MATSTTGKTIPVRIKTFRVTVIQLKALGFEILDDQKQKQIEKIKALLIRKVQSGEIEEHFGISTFLTKTINKEYSYISRLFSEVQGTTIAQFLISHKVERIKELIIYDELNISEIAWKMNYSSVAHLSNQFKKVTGLSPSHFKQLKDKRRSPIEEIGNSKNVKLN